MDSVYISSSHTGNVAKEGFIWNNEEFTIEILRTVTRVSWIWATIRVGCYPDVAF